MRIVAAIVLGLIVSLQYPLWFGSGGVVHLWQLKRQISEQRAENAQFKERDAALEAEVQDLKTGYAAIEERARSDLGMIKKGETFYQIVDAPPPTVAPASRPTAH